MLALTDRQREVYDFVREAIRTQGCAPTLRQVGHHLGIASTNGVVDHLKALERKGWIRRVKHRSRAIVVVEDTEDVEAAVRALERTGGPECGPASTVTSNRLGILRRGGLAGWRRIRYRVLQRDGFRCVACGATASETRLHVDHITPVCRGGKTTADNLQTLCGDCNHGKGRLDNVRRLPSAEPHTTPGDEVRGGVA